MVYRRLTAAGCFFVAVALLATQADGREVSREQGARADGIVEILNASGSVRVVGWDRETVSVTGRLQEDGSDVRSTGDDYRTSVEVVPAEGATRAGAADLTIRVPASSRVEVGAVTADVNVSNVVGAVFVYTVHGKTEVTGSPTEVEARSLKGDIRLAVTGSRVKVNTAAGRTTLSNVTGEADISTVSGKVDVIGGQLGRGRFRTVSGDLDFSAGLGVGGAFEFSTHSGNISLRVSESVPADFDVSTRVGRLTNNLSPAADRRGPGAIRPRRRGRGRRRPAVERAAPRVEPEQRQLSFSTGPGTDSVAIGAPADGLSRRARITASSFNGDISLSRK